MQPSTPGSPPVIELASLPQRHPVGDAILNLFGAQTVVRLGLDPVRAPPRTLQRDVTVDRLSPPVPCTASVAALQIGWNGLPLFSEDYLLRVSRTANEHDITEKAAIGVMALLIHELEGVIVQEVLPIGSGGDYAICLKTGNAPCQVEVSGIRDEQQGGTAASRLREKLQQVLSQSDRGFASVTTFRWKGGNSAHSYLHYVEKTKPTRGGKRKTKSKKPKKRKKK